jgi:hypothetical protein
MELQEAELGVCHWTGYTLAEALQRHPGYFDPLYCCFIEEASGRMKMCAVLEQLSQSKFHV